MDWGDSIGCLPVVVYHSTKGGRFWLGRDYNFRGGEILIGARPVGKGCLGNLFTVLRCSRVCMYG